MSSTTLLSSSQPHPVTLPHSLSDRCCQPYRFNAALALRGLPITVLSKESQTAAELQDCIMLSAPVMDQIRISLERGFEKPAAARKLEVFALCSPRLDDSLVVDAAVMHSAHSLKADLVVLNTEDLADGEHGILGREFCTALWDLHRLASDSHDDAKGRLKPVAANEAFLRQLLFQATSNATTPDSDSNVSSDSSERPASATQDHDVVFARAVTFLRALIDFRSSSSHPARRRLLYLRNFAAMNYGIRPMLEALLHAIQASDIPVLVVAGIWGVTPLYDADPTGMSPEAHNNSGEHAKFVSAFRSPDSLKGYIEREFTPGTYRLGDAADQFSSLSDVFLTGIMQRYGARRLVRRSRSADSTATRFEYARALPVIGECRRPSLTSETSSVSPHVARWNFGRLEAALRALDIRLQPPVPKVDDWATQAGPTARRFTSEIFPQSELAALAATIRDSLPSSASHADLLASLTRYDAASEVLGSHLKAIQPDCGSQDALIDAAIRALKQQRILERDVVEQLRNLIVDAATIETTYEDVCVPQDIIDALMSEIQSLGQNSGKGKGSKIVSNFLLYGPPGTGKTMLSRAVAKESGLRMIHIRPSDIQSHLVGISEKVIRCIFDLARRIGPCIIFVDEVDALFGRRGESGRSEGWRRSMVVEFMQEIDGLTTGTANKANNIIVIGATNRPQDVDDAVLRRLPRRILVDLPTLAAREDIIRRCLKGEESDASVDIPRLATRTALYSGSDLQHLVLVAAQAAYKDSLPANSRNATPATSRTTDATPRPAVISERHFELALRRIKASCLTNLDALRRVQQFERGEEQIQKRSTWVKKFLRRFL